MRLKLYGLASVFTALLASAGCLFGQAPPPDSEDLVIKSSVKEVVLDVVVRQKNMQLARKLKASDFMVTEDGTPQTIKGFRFVSKDEPPMTQIATPAGTPSKVVTGTRKIQEPSFVSIVFEQVGPHTRKYARDAVLAFLKQELNAYTYVAIFGLDYRMNVLQNFSNDRARLTAAVERASLGNYSSQSADNANLLAQSDYAVSGGPGGISIGSSVNFGTTPELATAGASESIDEGAQAAAKIVADQREIVMYQGGMRTVTALLNLVKYEASLPGRKTVIYVSEGLNLPPGQHELIRDVVSNANRANVSFYGIDVRGLSLFNANALAKNLTASAAATSRSQSSRPQLVTPGMAKQMDTLLEANVGNNQLNMQELAEDTGGFAVFNTNEFDKAMLRVMEDVRTHYEISYTPTSDLYDGHFRKIAVTVDDPKLTVQSRDGYFALPDLNGQSIQAFEMQGLTALSQKPSPQAFPFRMAALRFHPAAQGFRYEIAFDLPTANITPKVNPEAHQARLHATFLALIKDARGQIIDKVSRDIDQNIPEDKLEQFRRGEMIFTAPVALAPGRYTIEGVATDSEGNRASTKRSSLVVVQPGPITISDVALVHDLEPLTHPRDPGDPLEFSGGKVTPELDGNSKSADNTSFYFVVYPGRGAAKPKVTISFLKDGAAVASTQPELSDPDEANSIPVIASAKLPPGDYVAQVTVQEGDRAMHRSTPFTVTQ